MYFCLEGVTILIKKISSIDENTGELLKTQAYKYQIFDPDKGYLFKSRSHYVKGYQGVRLSDVVTNRTDYASMHLLAESLYKETNMIYSYRNKKYYPADIKDMANITGLSERYTKEFLSRMITAGIIAKVIVNTHETVQIQYHINPLYFNTNKYLSPALYMLFRKQLDEHLPEWVVKLFNT